MGTTSDKVLACRALCRGRGQGRRQPPSLLAPAFRARAMRRRDLAVDNRWNCRSRSGNGWPEAYCPPCGGASTAGFLPSAVAVDGTAIGAELERAQVVLCHAGAGCTARSACPRHGRGFLMDSGRGSSPLRPCWARFLSTCSCAVLLVRVATPSWRGRVDAGLGAFRPAVWAGPAGR